MAKGENIFKRKDGRWEARYVKGYDLSGKIKYGFCYGRTYKEAKEKVLKCKAALATGRSLPQSKEKHRFGYYCDAWFASAKVNLKAATFVKYASILEKHIKPKLGGCYPLGLSTDLVDRFRDDLLFVDELSPKTVKDVLVLLRSVLNYTAKQFPNMFPQIEITYPKEAKKEMRVLSRDEQQRLVGYLQDETDACKFGVLLSLFTGIRIGELCALRWENISLADNTIKISSTMQRLQDPDGDTKTKITIGTPKSDTSQRTIPLTEQAAELCRRMHPRNKAAYVLTGTEKYMEPRTLQYRLEKYTRDCGLEGVHFHTLRHTFATRCVEVGFEIKSLSEILGHASTTITLDRYVHASIALKRDNMSKLAAVGL